MQHQTCLVAQVLCQLAAWTSKHYLWHPGSNNGTGSGARHFAAAVEAAAEVRRAGAAFQLYFETAEVPAARGGRQAQWRTSHGEHVALLYTPRK